MVRSITADTDLRLARALGTSEGFWLGLQTDYDLEEIAKNQADYSGCGIKYGVLS